MSARVFTSAAASFWAICIASSRRLISIAARKILERGIRGGEGRDAIGKVFHGQLALVDSRDQPLALGDDLRPAIVGLRGIAGGFRKLCRFHKQQQPARRIGGLTALTGSNCVCEISLRFVVATEPRQNIDELQDVVVQLRLADLRV